MTTALNWELRWQDFHVERDIIRTTVWEAIASALQQAEARTGSPCLTWHPEVSTERCPGILW